MAHPPHIVKILNLLELSGTGNPNANERELAREKADLFMKRAGVTLEQMRELYRIDHGIPPKPSTSAGSDRGGERPSSNGGNKPRKPRARRGPPKPDSDELDRLWREAMAREQAAQEETSRARMAQAQAERERAAKEQEEKGLLIALIRNAIIQARQSHLDFADFIDALFRSGIQMTIPAENAVDHMVYRCPPLRVAVHSADLGVGYDWPSLFLSGIQPDLRKRRHREVLALMFMG